MPRIVKPAAERRREILDCAMELFAEQGYDATTVSQVIARLGISKGAFYHHFAAKEDLLEALARQFAMAAAEDARAAMTDDSLDAFCRLSRFLNSARDRKANEMPRLQKAFEPLFRPENLQLYYRTHFAVIAEIQPMLTTLIREGVEDRAFDTPDPENAAQVILQLMATTRREVAGTLHARTREEQERAIAQLHRKITYIGTVMDRILGLPDGSLELGDIEFLRRMVPPPEPRPDAAALRVVHAT